MRKSSVLIVSAFLFFACSKSPNSNNPNSQSSLIDSTGFVSKCLLVYPDSDYYQATFHYDANGNLAGFSDTTVQHNPYQLSESQKYFFNYDPTTNLITSYKLLWRKFYYDSTDNVEEHVILYDNQNRITEDSMVSENGASPKPSQVSRMVYSDQLSVMNLSDWGIDSLTTMNGNVTREGFYEIYNGKVSADFINAFTPNANFANPFYNEKMPAAIRIFLTQIDVNDWLSKNLSDLNGEKITWLKDSNGRVNSGSGDAGTKVTFVYQ